MHPRRPEPAPPLQTTLLSLLILVTVAVSTACSNFIPGQWEHQCSASPLVPDADRCHAALDLDDTALAVIPEADGWLFAGAWLGEDYRLIQATFDIPGLRRSVRLEDGYCSGPVCWIEFTDTEIERIVKRGSFRVELTRVMYEESGRMRRGTTGFHAPTRGMRDAIEQLRTDASTSSVSHEPIGRSRTVIQPSDHQDGRS